MSKPTEHDLCDAELRSMTVIANRRLDKINELKSENQALRDELLAARKTIYDYWCNVDGKAGNQALSRLDKFLNKGEGK